MAVAGLLELEMIVNTVDPVRKDYCGRGLVKNCYCLHYYCHDDDDDDECWHCCYCDHYDDVLMRKNEENYHSRCGNVAHDVRQPLRQTMLKVFVTVSGMFAQILADAAGEEDVRQDRQNSLIKNLMMMKLSTVSVMDERAENWTTSLMQSMLELLH